jgi:hypothetical protein
LCHGHDEKLAALVRGITIAQLLSHTSGLSQDGFTGYSPTSRDRPSLLDIVLGRRPSNTPPIRLQALPGQEFAYSGGGFVILQIVVEHVTGNTFDDAVRSLVFQPLHMTRSSYCQLSEREQNAAFAHYTGVAKCDEPYRDNPEAAAAGLWTTPSDMLRIVRAIQQSLCPSNPAPFLRESTAKAMLTRIKDDMGVGWFLPPGLGSTFVHAGSNVPGFRAHVVGFANAHRDSLMPVPKDCGIAIMTNSAIGSIALWKIMQAASYLMCWPVIPRTYGSYGVGVIPFELPWAAIGSTWQRWQGEWQTDVERWSLSSDESMQPTIRRGGGPTLRLIAAAAGDAQENGGFVVFVIRGLSLMVKMQENDTIHVTNGSTQRVSVLQRVIPVALGR